MKLAEVEQYIGLPYSRDAFDCADLVAKVQREIFGRHVQMPARRPRGAVGQVALGALSKACATWTDKPVNGDLVLMYDKDQKHPGHVGVYFCLDHEAWVLHATSALSYSGLHRVRELLDQGIQIEGYYQWS